MVNSRAKGARGEREWRDQLRALGCSDARRGQQFAGGADSPDVVGGWAGTHCEVKRVENLNLELAMQQAERDAGASIPYVAHRKDGKEWMVTVRAARLIEFCEAVLSQPRKDDHATDTEAS